MSTAVLLALCIWFPLLLIDLDGSYPPSLVFSSPVLTRVFLFSAGVWVLISAPIGVAAAGVGALVERRLSQGGVCARDAFVMLASAGTVALREGPLSVSRGTTLFQALGAAALAALALVALVLVLPQPLRERYLRALALGSLVLWAAALYGSLRLEGPEIVVLIGALTGAAAWVVGRALAPVDPRATAALAVALGVGLPLVTIAVADPGGAPRLPEPEVAAAPDAPNVVLLVIDTLRADQFLKQNRARTMPLLAEALGAKATLFTQATATASSTKPSINSLFTAQLPSGAMGMRNPTRNAWTLASAFRAAGYDTAGFTANSLVSGPGFENGFRRYRATLGFWYVGESFFATLFSGANPFKRLLLTEKWDLHKEDGRELVAQTSEWFEGARDGVPFFAYIHLMDPHWPYYDRGFGGLSPALRALPLKLRLAGLIFLPKRNPANARFLDDPRLEELRARYDEEVRLADYAIGQLLDMLAALDLRRRTLIVIVGDHGEEFFDHLSFSHGHDVYQPLVHVPMIFLWPDDPRFADMPARVETPISLLDVLPTLTDYLALPRPPRPVQGHTLRPLLEGTHEGPWFPVVSEVLGLDKVIAAYREGRLKVRMSYPPRSGPRRTKAIQVFDLAADPKEQNPLALRSARAKKVIARAKRTHLRDWQKRRKKVALEKPRKDAPDLDTDAEARLKALGYID